MYPFKSQSGLGLIEIIVAMGIMAAVVLAISDVAIVGQKSITNVQFRSQGGAFHEEIRGLFSDQQACRNTFAGLVAQAGASYPITALRDGKLVPPPGETVPGEVRYAPGTTDPEDVLSIQSMTLSDYQPGTNMTNAVMTLRLLFEAARPVLGASVISRNIDLAIQRDPATGAILSCISLARMSDGIWQVNPVDMDSILYTMPDGSSADIFNANDQPLGGVTLQLKSQKQSVVRAFAHSDMVFGSPAMTLTRARGSIAAPSLPRSGDRLGHFSFVDHDVVWGGAWGGMESYATENHTAAAKGSRLAFSNYRNGANTATVNMSIIANGFVGIGALTPTSRLQVGMAGDGSAGLSNAWNVFSDRNLKTIDRPITNALESIDALEGYYYFWKNNKKDGRQIGLMAQDVEKVYPELVKTDQNKIKSVDYGKLNAVLVEAIKELKRQNIELQQRVRDLEASLN